MKKKEKIKLTSIGRNLFFDGVIKKLTLNEVLTGEEETFILSCAILFLKEYEKDKKILSYADIAYYIILKYSLSTSDYKPLYDFSINFGFYPISKTILENNLLENITLDDYVIKPKIEEFKHEQGHIETLNQFNTRKNFIRDFSFEKSYIAPTSFGKSSVIVEYIKTLQNYEGLKIVVVVPTKSLLMQTYKMMQASQLSSKLIIHDDIVDNTKGFIAIFTQERALKLINKNICFDILIIDEAHKIFETDRGILISRLIRKNSLCNPSQKVIYLSPLVENTENLKVSEDQNISAHNIKFNLKEPEFFELKIHSGEVYKYNRFVNRFYEIESQSGLGMFRYFELNKGEKNFIFENNPQKIEKLAKDFCESGVILDIGDQSEIKDLQNILAEKIHEDYFAIKYIKYGIIYIHGQLPDLIKEYLEHKFKTVKSINYIIANTVILEGINLPIDTLFICGSRMISNGKSLLNLVGRVNRLDKIFAGYKQENLYKLLPKIHVINEGVSKHDSRFEYLRSRVFEDTIKNPILPSYDINNDGPSKRNKEERERFVTRVEKLQKYESFIYNDTSSERDDVKKYFIENGISNYYRDAEIAVDSFIKLKDKFLSERGNQDNIQLMEKISKTFIPDDKNISDLEFRRLSRSSTQKYYEGYFSFAMRQNLKVNIEWQIKRFNEIINNDTIPKNKKAIYIGESYGDTTWDTDNWEDSVREVYISLNNKSQKDLINIAIVKLQIESNFVSFTLNKFIRALYDFKLITEEDYNIYTYGTGDSEKIKLHKQGLSLNIITKLLEAGQLKNIIIDDYNNLIGNDNFKEYLLTVDDFYQFELKRYINLH